MVVCDSIDDVLISNFGVTVGFVSIGNVLVSIDDVWLLTSLKLW